MQRTMMDFWVGVFVIAGFAAMLVLALKVGNLGNERQENTYSIEARFENIGGLKPRAPVKAAGVLVGRVTDISFDTKTYQAVVHLAMYQRYPFPKDSSVAINTSGLLGEVYVGIDAGGDTANLKEGDKVKITQSAVVLEKLISQFMFSKAQEASTPAPAAAPAAATK